MRRLSKVTKALADPNRLMILRLLAEGELCVCWLVACLRLAPSTVSKHLSLLENAGLIAVRREGKWGYYRLADIPGDRPEAGLFAWLLPALQREAAADKLDIPMLIRKCKTLVATARPSSLRRIS